jgi:hypothetical protein
MHILAIFYTKIIKKILLKIVRSSNLLKAIGITSSKIKKFYLFLWLNINGVKKVANLAKDLQRID